MFIDQIFTSSWFSWLRPAGFGHYEDELVKVKGRWLFSKRRIYNENRDEWAYKATKNLVILPPEGGSDGWPNLISSA